MAHLNPAEGFKDLQDRVKEAVAGSFPQEGKTQRLELEEVEVQDKLSSDDVTTQKKAKMNGRTWGVPVHAKLVLKDKKTGKVIDRQRIKVATLPKITNRYSYIVEGSEYQVDNQWRLKPGVYTKVQENGELDSFLNVKGTPFHVGFDPKERKFNMKHGGTKPPLYPIMKALGHSDDDLQKTWGKDILNANMLDKRGKPLKVDKIAIDFAKRLDPKATVENFEQASQVIQEELQKNKLDPESTKRTLGKPLDSVSPETMLRSSKRLLGVARGTEKPDTRDALMHKDLLSIEDFIGERLTQSKKVIDRRIGNNIDRKGKVRDIVGMDVFQRPVKEFFTKVSLVSTPEQTNPLKMISGQMRTTIAGEGGVKDANRITEDAKLVDPSHFAALDPLHTPECHDDQTEVFTERGWVSWAEVTDSDYFACRVDGRLEFHKADRIIREPYRGVLYGAETRYLSYRVTPGHKMWCHTGDKRSPLLYQWHFELAENMFGKTRNVTTIHEPYAGEGLSERFSVPHVQGNNSSVNFDDIEIDAWAAFLGWYLSKGSFRYDESKSAYSVKITQSAEVSPEHCKEIERVLNRLPYNWSFSGKTYTIGVKQLAHYVSQFGKCEDKFIPEYMFKTDVRAREELLAALLLGDGRVNYRRTNGDLFHDIDCFTTSSKKLANDIERLIISLGYAATNNTYQDKREDRYLDIHEVRILRRRERVVRAGIDHVKEDYDGMVYCATVPGELLYTRRNGKTPFWSGNSGKTGVSLQISLGAKKNKNKLEIPLINAKTGKMERLDPGKINDSIVALPDDVVKRNGKYVPKSGTTVKASVKDNELRDVEIGKVDYVVPRSSQMFSLATNMVPFISSDSPNRATMAGRHMEQAIPLKDAEPPLVQSQLGKKSFDEIMGSFASHNAPTSGKITKITPDTIHIKDKKGKAHKVPVYNHYPLNDKKGMMHSTPSVKVGEAVKEGQVIADTNYTRKGVYAPGKNLEVGYMPWKGYNFEDGVVISETAAKKLTSEHLHKKGLSTRELKLLGKKKYQAYYQDRLDKEQFEKLDDGGVVKVGQKVKPGDTLIAALAEQQLTTEEQKLKLLHKSLVKPYKDKAITWEEDYEGEVVEVNKRGSRVDVHVKTSEPMDVGDKLVGRHGNKGIVTKILPDEEMPQSKEGKALEVLMNPIGTPGRMNVGQVLETAAAKVAKKTGKPFRVTNFEVENNLEYVKKELEKHGISDKEDVVDPKTGKAIKGVQVGPQYIFKLEHQVGKKMAGRSRDAYDRNLVPKGGGKHGAQALGALGLYAMLAHGAKANIREMGTYKSDKAQGGENDELWTALQAGEPLPPPRTTFAYKKFNDYLKAAGVNTEKDGNSLNLVPLTDKQVLEMSNGELKDAGRAVKMRTMAPEKGGLFDEKITGGTEGDKWCFHPMTRVVTEKGLIPIGRIVNEKLDVKVLSRSDEGELQWKSIANYWKNTTEEPLVQLNFNSRGHLAGYQRRSSRISTLWCTSNHEIYTERGKQYAKYTEGAVGYLASHKLSHPQKQLVLGSLLGDSYLEGGSETQNWMFRCGHGPAQIEYLDLKSEVLSEFVDAPIGEQYKKEEGPWRERTTFTIRTIRHPVFSEVHKIVYKDDRKTVTPQWLSQIDERGLAFWYMNDGSVSRFQNKIRVALCTQGFYEQEVLLLQEWLGNRWGILSTTVKSKEYEGKPYGWSINIHCTEALKFLELVAPYIPDCLRYKAELFYEPAHCRECGEPIGALFSVCGSCVLSQVKTVASRRQYQALKDRVLDESAIRKRYGSWSKAKAMANKEIPTERPTQIVDTFAELRSSVGTKLGELFNPTEECTVPVVIDKVIQGSDKRYSKQNVVYNIEVADNHNYFANGLLVGNSHIKLAEPMPNPLFEKAIMSVSGIRGPQFDRIINGENGVMPDGTIVEKKGTKGATYGPSAMGNLLKNVDVKKKLAEEEARLPKLRGQLQNEARRKVKYLRALNKLDMKPTDAYMMKNVPVLPPNMRPLAVLDDGSVQTDDLNELYKQLAIVDKQYKAFPKGTPASLKAPLAADTYDHLKALTGLGGTLNRKHPGLIDVLSGREGPKSSFAQSVLIKRKQDLTLRSTIVPEPSLSLDEVEIPRKAAKDAYKPFIMRELRRTAGASPLEAKKMIDNDDPLAKKALDRVVKDRPLLLKRDPALHKYSIQAFKPKLVEGKAIKIHPLVCSGYNADFDGDTMSAYVPITEEATEEARRMFPSRNLFSPATHDIMYTPTHEAQVGLFMKAETGKRTVHGFKNQADLEKAVKAGKLSENDIARVGKIRTTLGRMQLDSTLPKQLQGGKLLTDMSYRFTKKEQGKLFSKMARADKKAFPVAVDKMRHMGNEAVTMGGFSMGLDDFETHKDIRDPAFARAARRTSKLNMNKPEDVDKFIDAYEDAMHEMDTKLKARAANPRTKSTLAKLEIAAGIKGKGYRQLTTAPGLFVDGKGEVVTSPVKQSYSEGLDTMSYWAATSGGRKGAIQRVQSVSEPGYLTKQMANSTMNMLVEKEDCGTKRGIALSLDEPDVVGRYTTSDVKLQLKKGKIPAGTLITPEVVTRLKNSKIDKVPVRSPMRCSHGKGLCKKCMGINEDGQLSDFGTNIGILATQSIGERGTQLAMKAFHSGGIYEGREAAAKSVSAGGLQRATNILNLPQKVKGSAVLATESGRVGRVKKDPAGGVRIDIAGKQHYVPANRRMLKKVRPGAQIKKGDPITRGPINPHEMLPLTGMSKVQGHMAEELHNIYGPYGIRRRHSEVLVRALSDVTKVESTGGNPDLLPGDFTNTSQLQEWNKKNPTNPVKHRPVLRGVKTIPLDVQTDWMARLNHEHLKSTLVEAAQQGWQSNLHGSHPIPPLIRGSEFGLGTKDKPWGY